MTDEEFKSVIEKFARQSGVFRTRSLVDNVMDELSIGKFDIDDSFIFEPMKKGKKDWR